MPAAHQQSSGFSSSQSKRSFVLHAFYSIQHALGCFPGLSPSESESELKETKSFAVSFRVCLDALAGMVGVRGKVTLWGVAHKDFWAWEINKHRKAEPGLEVKCNWKSKSKMGGGG